LIALEERSETVRIFYFKRPGNAQANSTLQLKSIEGKAVSRWFLELDLLRCCFIALSLRQYHRCAGFEASADNIQQEGSARGTL
jgi:hypothetical protein